MSQKTKIISMRLFLRELQIFRELSISKYKDLIT